MLLAYAKCLLLRPLAACWLAAFLFGASTLQSAPVFLRCEYLQNPLGIDIPKPALSWRSDSTERNWKQSAYQILVASEPGHLTDGKADIWNSGKQLSAESIGIAYGGPTLQSRKRYYWAVKVWDEKDHAAISRETAWWEMGLLQPSDWHAQWIRWQNPEESDDEASIHWIWVQGQDPRKVLPGTEAVFHLEFQLTEPAERAALFLIAKGDWKVTVNGHDAGAKPHWNEFDRREIGSLLTQGTNSVDVHVTIPQPPGWRPDSPPPNAPRPGALAALVKIREKNRHIRRIPTDSNWTARIQTEAQLRPAAVAGDLQDPAFAYAAFPHPFTLPQPAALFRRDFAVEKHVRNARAYVTALGTYSLFLNGRRVGRSVLTPGFTEFEKRIQYQTYDVTDLLMNGKNTAGVMLGSGWFGSGLSWTAERFPLSPRERLLLQLEIEYTDGSREAVQTDGSWKAAESPVLHSEIYAGETYDARLEQPGWNRAGFDDRSWQAVTPGDSYTGAISAQIDTPPQIVMQVKPEHISILPNQTYVVDMGQNMVGWTALRVKGTAGETVRLRFAEILKPDGSIYTENLRNADATDFYTLRGGGEEVFQPNFTFHGFRYVEITGYPGVLTSADLTGEVVSSLAGEPTASVTTSSELVNRMWNLGIWGERSNFLSIPTDCPQRDERLGWMADAAVFWRTGSYNFDIAAFTHKWLRDVRDSQLANGAFTNVSPNIGVGDFEGAPGWGDAGVIVPWTAWFQYGDRSSIDRNWDAMERWMKFIADANPDFIRKNKVGPDFSDWLAVDGSTPKSLTDTAYWAVIADMMVQMAHATGRTEAEKGYTELYSHIQEAFRAAYVKPDGTVGSGSQTSYVLALQMKLLPPSLEPAAVDKLVQNIEEHQWHLTTGFLGTPYLLFALSNHGKADVAYRLLLNDTYPSWGYMVKKGATTWWERWNGDTGDPAMNSYNHYAFGSVMAWVYRNVTGIDTTSSGPGFREITIHVHPNSQMTAARGEYQSVYGRIATEWNQAADHSMRLKVTIPPNTAAKVIVPDPAFRRVTVDGKPADLSEASGERFALVPSGTYVFEMK